MNQELEDMKQQLAALRSQLDKEVVMREDALRRTLRQRAGSFKSREVVSMVFVLVVALVLPLVMFELGCSLALCLFTGISLLLMAGWSYYVYHTLHVGHILDQDLLTAQTDLQTYKRWYRNQLMFVGMPWVAVFFVWYLVEQYTMHLTNIAEQSASYHVGYLIGMGASMTVGGVIGGLIGYFTFYRPQMKLADKMMQEIEDLTCSNER